MYEHRQNAQHFVQFIIYIYIYCQVLLDILPKLSDFTRILKKTDDFRMFRCRSKQIWPSFVCFYRKTTISFPFLSDSKRKSYGFVELRTKTMTIKWKHHFVRELPSPILQSQSKNYFSQNIRPRCCDLRTEFYFYKKILYNIYRK